MASTSDWMQNIYENIKWKTLRQVCLPFSHDAGMSKVEIPTGLPPLPNDQMLTQSLDISGQLAAGARFFDIRPLFCMKQYYTCHGQGILNNWLGAAGQSMDEVCSQVNDFTAQHAELVILELSHAIAGEFEWGVKPLAAIGAAPPVVNDMSQELYIGLFNNLAGKLNNLYICPDPHADLTQLPMSDFIGNKKACVIVTLSDDGITIPSQYLGKGFFYGVLSNDVDKVQTAAVAGRKSQLYYAGTYSDSDDPDYVDHDQITKMGQARAGADWNPPFLLEFTITEQLGPDLVFSSIKAGADLIKPKLYKDLPSNILDKAPYFWNTYPNMIGVDFFEPAVTQLALTINQAPSIINDNWSYEIISAFWGPKDVTNTVRADKEDFESKLRMSSTPYYSVAPYQINVNVDTLGTDPSPGVPKRLVVLVSKFNYNDDCLSYLIQYSAADFETLVLDPREMNLSKSYAQRPTQIANQKLAGAVDWTVKGVMYGPIDPCALMNENYDEGYIGQNRVDVHSLPDSFVVDYTLFQMGTMVQPWTKGGQRIPCQLRVLLMQSCVNQTQQYNKTNTTTYTLVTAYEGDSVTLGPTKF